jgi:hypothetical protein
MNVYLEAHTRWDLPLGKNREKVFLVEVPTEYLDATFKRQPRQLVNCYASTR